MLAAVWLKDKALGTKIAAMATEFGIKCHIKMRCTTNV
jgi:hypothetical protein